MALVSRIIHILTERQAPSPELVNKVGLLLLLLFCCPYSPATPVLLYSYSPATFICLLLFLLVQVRDLYAKRVADVRFLIPVLNGLTRQEVAAALPKLIKLNPVVVKEVVPCLSPPSPRRCSTGCWAQATTATEPCSPRT